MITRHDNILIVLFPESEIEKGCADIFLPKNQNTCHNNTYWSSVVNHFQILPKSPKSFSMTN